MEKLKFRMLFAIFLLTHLSALTISQSCVEKKVQITCDNVSSDDHRANGEDLTCWSDSMNVLTADVSVSSVVDKNNSDFANLTEVKEFVIHGSSIVKFIPNGISDKFPHLKAFKIYLSQLLSVGKDNLKGFGDSLENLDLYGNRITYIEADLLEYNTNLNYISFNYNPIRFIASEFFLNLKKLKNVGVVWFGSAACIDQIFDDSDGHKLSTFTWKKDNCIDVTAKTETENLIKKGKSECSMENV